jgi:hypothetical protein
MPGIGHIEELHVTSVDIENRRYDVTVGVEFDGVEYVGHLWFCDEEWDDEGIRDHGGLPGKSAGEIREHAKSLSPEELRLRFQRAQAEKRRFHGLRRITEEVLASIRYLNTVATSMRAGLLDVEEAAAEIDSTERRLHDMIGQLRHFAGVAA